MSLLLLPFAEDPGLLLPLLVTPVLLGELDVRGSGLAACELLLLGAVPLWFPVVLGVSVPEVLPVVPMVDDDVPVLLLGC